MRLHALAWPGPGLGWGEGAGRGKAWKWAYGVFSPPGSVSRSLLSAGVLGMLKTSDFYLSGFNCMVLVDWVVIGRMGELEGWLVVVVL